ncbi:MAG TPA: hypothetical protein VIL35_11375 [Vicinamibacterales bacterium]
MADRVACVVLLGTAPVPRVRELAAWARSRCERLVIAVPESRRAAFVDVERAGARIVTFAGTISRRAAAWKDLHERLRACAPDQIVVAVNDAGHTSYARVERALASAGGPFCDAIFLARPGDDGTPGLLTRRQVRRAILRARWHAPIAWLMAAAAWIAQRPWAVTAVLTLALLPFLDLLVTNRLLLSVLLLVLAHAAAAWYASGTRGEYTGDAAIHFQFASRFARGEWYCYNPGQFAAASSSPLWTALLGLVCRIAGASRLERVAQAICWISLQGALLIISAAAVAILGWDSLWGIAPAVLAGSPVVFLWTARAMEAPFALLVTCLVALAMVQPSVPGWAAVALAAAFLVRWEHLLLLAPAAAYAAWQQGSVWPLLSPLPALALAADTFRRTGAWLPASGRARRLYAALRAGAWRGDWRIWTDRPDLLLLAAAGVFAAGVGHPLTVVALSWIVLTIVCFVRVMPGTYEGRYLVPSMAPIALLAAAGLDRLCRVEGTIGELVGAAGLAAVAAFWHHTVWRRRGDAVRDAARAADLERGFRQTVAADLSRLLPQGARLALIEIDLLWPMRRDDVSVIGMDGVLDGGMLQALEAGRFLPELRRRGATHVLIETCLHERPGWSASDVAPLRGAAADAVTLDGARAVCRHVWTYRNWGTGEPSPWILWELEWQRAAGAAQSMPTSLQEAEVSCYP